MGCPTRPVADAPGNPIPRSPCEASKDCIAADWDVKALLVGIEGACCGVDEALLDLVGDVKPGLAKMGGA